MFLQPHRDPGTREVTGHHEEGGDRDIQAPSRWDKLVAEFHDIFNHQECLWKRILCITLSFFPMLNLTTDFSTECLQLKQQK